ncbi:MAG: glycoside hydrolase family protein [Saccharofermentanales bacterium]
MITENVRYSAPFISGEYVNVYQPTADTYKGPDSICFKNSTFYEKWVANDFSMVKGPDNRWHMIGITHPSPDGFINGFEFDGRTLHDAEWQLFHSVGMHEELKDNLYKESFIDQSKILYPQDRPGEQNECWAPCVLRKDSKYHLFYSPKSMRLAVSPDLFHWDIMGTLFEGSPMMRDPFIYYEDSIYHMIYVEDHLYVRTSSDLQEWSEPRLFQKSPFIHAAQESPFLFKKDDVYYLIWCLHDGLNGCYDNRTFVYCNKSLDGFDGISPITMLKAHAPEIIQDEDGQYYIFSAYYPYNGVNIARLEWES